MRHSHRILGGLTTTLLALACCSGCGDGGAGDDEVERASAVYAEVIREVAATSDLEVEDARVVPTIYVTASDGTTIDIAVQAEVVNALDDWGTVRFIDSIEEAVDDGEPKEPVREGGILIGLGPVPAGVATVSLYADRYEDRDNVMVFTVELRRSDGTWSVVEPLVGSRVSPP